MLNYIAALLTFSTKDFLSHLFTMEPDDMVICSLNVRGLSNNTKRRERFYVLRSSTSESSLLTFSAILASVVCIWLKRFSIVSSISNFLSTASSFDPTPSAISKDSNTSSGSEAVECAFTSSFIFFFHLEMAKNLWKVLTGFCACPALKHYKFSKTIQGARRNTFTLPSYQSQYRFSLFPFVSDGNFQVQLRGRGLYLEGRFNRGLFALRVCRAYTWRGLFSEFYGKKRGRKLC